MLAARLATPVRAFTHGDSALDALLAMNQTGLMGVVVVDNHGRPIAVLSAARVLWYLIPPYVHDDPTLARVMGDHPGDVARERLDGKTLSYLLAKDAPGTVDEDMLVVQADDSVLEVAAMMSTGPHPFAVVVEGEDLLGVITEAALVKAVIADDSEHVQ